MARDLEELPRVLLYDTLQERTYDGFERESDFISLCEKLAANPPFFRIAYRSLDERRGLEADFDFCCRAVLACREICFAVEEVDLFSNPHSLPLPLEHIVSVGRHKGLSFYCASRRSPAIHPLIRSQAHQIITFCQTEPRDIAWLAEVMGEQAKSVPSLGLHKFLLWRDDGYSFSS